jgi:hypothetical protein
VPETAVNEHGELWTVEVKVGLARKALRLHDPSGYTGAYKREPKACFRRPVAFAAYATHLARARRRHVFKLAIFEGVSERLFHRLQFERWHGKKRFRFDANREMMSRSTPATTNGLHLSHVITVRFTWQHFVEYI